MKWFLRTHDEKYLQDRLRSQNLPVPSSVENGTANRSSVEVPQWVKEAMFFRWMIVLPFLPIASVLSSFWPIVVGLIGYMISGKLIFWLFKRHSPVSAEIAFYNARDGYFHNDENKEIAFDE